MDINHGISLLPHISVGHQGTVHTFSKHLPLLSRSSASGLACLGPSISSEKPHPFCSLCPQYCVYGLTKPATPSSWLVGRGLCKCQEHGVCSAWWPLLLCEHSQEIFVDDNNPILAPDLDREARFLIRIKLNIIIFSHTSIKLTAQ